LIDEACGAEGRPHLGWNDLTREQRHVLDGCFHEDELAVILAGWVGSPDLSIRGPYVPPLAEAAKFLIEHGLVEVLAQERPIGESAFLSAPDGADIVMTYNNWWDETCTDDPDSQFVEYSLIATDAGAAVGRSRNARG
jgi:hypothetical protein